jgi:23S rRNA-/tRNA-specific pseudouridylate synthase
MSIEDLIFNPVQIIHQDENISVVNKTSGLLTTSDGYNPKLPYL